MQTRSNLSNSPMVHGSRRKENKLRLPHESVATLEEGQTSTVLEQSPRKRIKLESKNDTEPTDGALSCPDIAVIERNISAGVQAVHADVDNNEAMLDQQRKFMPVSYKYRLKTNSHNRHHPRRCKYSHKEPHNHFSP
jgi:hypothetical protein